MDKDKAMIVEQIEEIFKDIGGFSWEQAETWASFCFAVGMDPLPQLKVMMNNICQVVNMFEKDTTLPSNNIPQLQLVKKGHHIRFNLIMPDQS